MNSPLSFNDPTGFIQHDPTGLCSPPLCLNAAANGGGGSGAGSNTATETVTFYKINIWVGWVPIITFGFNDGGFRVGFSFVFVAIIEITEHTREIEVADNSQTDEPIDERPDLGRTGNILRSQLDDPLAKDNFEQYWLGRGDLDLTKEQFDSIVSVIGENTPIERTLRFSNPELLGRSRAVKYDFYGTKYNGLLGDAWIIYDNNGQAIGLYDQYDFNSKPFFERTVWSEIQTRGVAWLSEFNDDAKPFTIRYRGSGN